MRADGRRGEARVGTDTFLQRPGRIVPNEVEVVIVAEDELIEQADRAAWTARYRPESGSGQVFLPSNWRHRRPVAAATCYAVRRRGRDAESGRIELRLTCIGTVDHGRKGEILIRRHGAGVDVLECDDAG